MWVIKMIFCLQLNLRVSYKLVLLLLVGMPGTQEDKFAISLYYFRNAGSIVFTGHSQACAKYPKACDVSAISQKHFACR